MWIPKRAAHRCVPDFLVRRAAGGLDPVEVRNPDWVDTDGVCLKRAAAALVRQRLGALAVELAPRGIRVNAVSAGWVESSEGERSYRGGVSDAVRPHVPAGRNVAPEDVAAAVAWVCSDETPMLVGQTIHLDGGFGLAAWNAVLAPPDG